jgi:glycine cleavage system H protein
MNMPKELKYTKTHEWVKLMDEKTATIGITDFAQHNLGNIVFVNIQSEGLKLGIGDNLADIESVKAVSDVFSPVAGVISKVNVDVQDSPELFNDAPYDSWIVEISDITDRVDLLSAEEYEEMVEKEA